MNKPTKHVTVGEAANLFIPRYWTYGDSSGYHVQKEVGGPVEWVPNGEARQPKEQPAHFRIFKTPVQ